MLAQIKVHNTIAEHFIELQYLLFYLSYTIQYVGTKIQYYIILYILNHILSCG